MEEHTQGVCGLVCFLFLKPLSSTCIQYLAEFYVFFGHEAHGIFAPEPRIKPAPPALEGEVLTTGPRGKSLELLNTYSRKEVIFYSVSFFLPSHILTQKLPKA